MTADLIDHYIKLHDRYDKLKAELKAVKTEIDVINSALIEQWVESGTSKVVRNGTTVKLSATWTEFHCWAAKGVKAPVLCQALIAAGLPDLVKTEPTYNSTKLKSQAWEWLKENAAIPNELQPLLDFGIVSRVRVK